MKTSAHYSSGSFPDRQATDSTLWHPVHHLIRNGKQAPRSVAQINKRTLQGPPLVAGYPQLLGGRTVHTVMNPYHRRIIILRITPRNIGTHVAIESILLNQVNPVLGRPVPFLVTGKEGAIAIDRHPIGCAEPIGKAPTLGAVLADLDNGTVVWHQPVFRVTRRLGEIEIARLISLQIHGELMEMFGDLMVVIKILIEINLPILIDIMQPRDLVTTTDIDGFIHNLQAQRLKHTCSDTAPGELSLGQIKPFHNPYIPLPGTNGRPTIVLKEIKPTQAHPRFPWIIVG